MTAWITQAAAVARVECRLQVVSVTWRLVVLIGAALACAICAANLQDFARRQAEVDTLSARRTDAAEGGRHVVSGFQRDAALRVVRAPAPLSVLIAGLDKQQAQYWDLGPEGLTAGTLVSGHRTLAISSDDIDLEFILRVLTGLLAVVVGAGSAVVARQGGMTKSLVSLPTHATALPVGALLGGACTIGLAVAIIVASAFATVAVLGPELMTGDALQTGVALWAVATLYGMVLQGAGASVALVTKRATDTIAAAVCLWLLATVMALAGAAALARGVAPVTTRALFEAERDAMYTKAAADIALGAGGIVSSHLDGRALTPRVRIEGPMATEVSAHWNEALASLRGRLDTLESRFAASESSQGRWASWLGAPFPGALFRQAAIEVAGVGPRAAERWTSRARDYQEALSAAVFDQRPRVHINIRSGPGYDVLFYDRAPRPTVSRLPVFTRPEMSTVVRFRDATWACVLLVLEGLLTWLTAVLTFVRRQASYGDWR